MLNCIWNGKLIEAEQISKTEDSESSVRRASENHELKCTDPFCKCSICYKHGPKRSPHFAHIGESNCAYAAFEKMILQSNGLFGHHCIHISQI